MAIVKVAKGGKSLSQALEYIDKEKDFLGKDLSDNKEKALEEMQTTKQIYNKEDGRQYKHYIISFKPNEVNNETAKKIALEFAEKNFKSFEVAIGTHTDKNHIHCHLIVNSVSFETGKKFNAPKSFLQDLKKSNDEICKSYGLEIVQKKIEKELTGEVRAYDMEKYQVLKKAFQENKKSYVLDTAVAVKESIKISKSKIDFIENMKQRGYKTSWIDSRKHITFTNSENKKVRLSNLEKTFSDKFFSKENLEYEFKRKNIEPDRTINRAEQQPSFIIGGTDERDQRLEQDIKIIHNSSNGQRNNAEHNINERISEDREHKREDTKEYNIDIKQTTSILERIRQHNANIYAEERKRIKEQQQPDNKGIELTKDRDKTRNIEPDEPHKERSIGHEL